MADKQSEPRVEEPPTIDELMGALCNEIKGVCVKYLVKECVTMLHVFGALESVKLGLAAVTARSAERNAVVREQLNEAKDGKKR